MLGNVLLDELVDSLPQQLDFSSLFKLMGKLCFCQFNIFLKVSGNIWFLAILIVFLRLWGESVFCQLEPYGCVYFVPVIGGWAARHNTTCRRLGNAWKIGEIFDLGRNEKCPGSHNRTCRSQGMVFYDIPIGGDDMGC